MLGRHADAGPDVAQALAAAVLPAARGAGRVAVYASFGTEPPTTCLVEGLRRAGVQVLLPVLLPDRDLDWTAEHPGRPAGPLLGVEAVATCSLVVVPALAVDAAGRRLGRGGGSYDRALARVPADVLTVALLHDGEMLDVVPTEPHDVPVRAVATPTGGLQRL
jgi:5-formyltetrahydrofolate cyclo-ligase